MLQGHARRDGSFGGAELGECIYHIVLCSRHMMKLTALKRDAELLDQEFVSCHVCVFRVLTASALLHHQVGISIAQDVSNADLLRQPDAMHQRFIFGDVVGCSK